MAKAGLDIEHARVSHAVPGVETRVGRETQGQDLLCDKWPKRGDKGRITGQEEKQILKGNVSYYDRGRRRGQTGKIGACLTL